MKDAEKIAASGKHPNPGIAPQIGSSRASSQPLLSETLVPTRDIKHPVRVGLVGNEGCEEACYEHVCLSTYRIHESFDALRGRYFKRDCGQCDWLPGSIKSCSKHNGMGLKWIRMKASRGGTTLVTAAHYGSSIPANPKFRTLIHGAEFLGFHRLELFINIPRYLMMFVASALLMHGSHPACPFRLKLLPKSEWPIGRVNGKPDPNKKIALCAELTGVGLPRVEDHPELKRLVLVVYRIEDGKGMDKPAKIEVRAETMGGEYISADKLQALQKPIADLLMAIPTLFDVPHVPMLDGQMGPLYCFPRKNTKGVHHQHCVQAALYYLEQLSFASGGDGTFRRRDLTKWIPISCCKVMSSDKISDAIRGNNSIGRNDTGSIRWYVRHPVEDATKIDVEATVRHVGRRAGSEVALSLRNALRSLNRKGEAADQLADDDSHLIIDNLEHHQAVAEWVTCTSTQWHSMEPP